MQISNVTTYEKISFNEYLALPGLSYSFVKRDGASISPTESMRFGSYVDAYVFEPSEYKGEKLNLVRPVAKEIKSQLGVLINGGKRQLAVTCKMSHRGLYIIYKGRLDLFAGGIVIDLKVSKLKIDDAIRIFGYHDQLSGYSLALGAKVAVLFSIHPETRVVSKRALNPGRAYWEEVVVKYGIPEGQEWNDQQVKQSVCQINL